MTFAGDARVVLIGNEKGGCGKTALTAAVAHAIATGGRGGGHKVLLIDGDRQGTMSKSDMGQRDVFDRGASLAGSLLFGQDLQPLVDVKRNLDLVAGGKILERVSAAAAAMPPEEMLANFEGALTRLCEQRGYEFVFIDSPPGEAPLLDTFMSTANYLVIPTMSDTGSLDGVEESALRYKKARRNGAGVALLGIALFGEDHSATARNADTFRQIEEMLGTSGIEPFRSIIRVARSVANDCRLRGVTPAEMIEVSKKARKETFKALEAGIKPSRPIWSSGQTAAKLATDYQALVYEIISRIAQYEERAAEEAGAAETRVAAAGV
jgi:cellulose biosynthesis protein BcsQ